MALVTVIFTKWAGHFSVTEYIHDRMVFYDPPAWNMPDIDLVIPVEPDDPEVRVYTVPCSPRSPFLPPCMRSADRAHPARKRRQGVLGDPGPAFVACIGEQGVPPGKLLRPRGILLHGNPTGIEPVGILFIEL